MHWITFIIAYALLLAEYLSKYIHLCHSLYLDGLYRTSKVTHHPFHVSPLIVPWLELWLVSSPQLPCHACAAAAFCEFSLRQSGFADWWVWGIFLKASPTTCSDSLYLFQYFLWFLFWICFTCIHPRRVSYVLQNALGIHIHVPL